MRKLLVGLLAAAFVLGISAHAGAKEMKIGFVEIRVALSDYNKAKTFLKELEDKDKARKQERDKKVEEIRKLKDEVDLLSAQAKEKKQVVLEQKIKELETSDKQFDDEMTRRSDEMRAELWKDVLKTIDDHAKKNGYDFIFDRRLLFYGSAEVDVTDDILKVLNK